MYEQQLTDEELEDLFRELMRSFADALFTTIHEAGKPSGKAKDGRVKVYQRWARFSDKVIKFAKETR